MLGQAQVLCLKLEHSVAVVTFNNGQVKLKSGNPKARVTAQQTIGYRLSRTAILGSKVLM